jgi:hypothetical protein
VINRRKALVGYATWFIGARLLARAMRRRSSRPRLGGLRDRQGGLMLKQKNTAATAVADRATTLVETVRPLVTKALNDPELHDALKKAFATGREVQGEIQGKPPRKAAEKLARDRKLQKKVEKSALDLQKAVSGLVEKPKKKKRMKRLLGTVAIVGAAAGAVVVAMRKLRGGGDEQPY